MKKTMKTSNLKSVVATTLDDALKTAADKVEALTDETKAVASKVEKQVKSAANRVNFDVEKARKDRDQDGRGALEEGLHTVDTVVEKTLHRFNVRPAAS